MEAMQPRGARRRILHASFVVKDVYESIQSFLDLYGVGPWFVFEHYPMKGLQYRGAMSKMDFTVAATYAGPLMLELIQQNDSEPSAYMDSVAVRGYGFHHFAIASDDFDRDLAHYRGLGFAVANEGAAPSDHGGSRGAYIDTTSRLPGMTELMEMVPEMTASLRELEMTAANWDGSDPIRVQKFG